MKDYFKFYYHSERLAQENLDEILNHPLTKEFRQIVFENWRGQNLLLNSEKKAVSKLRQFEFNLQIFYLWTINKTQKASKNS